MCLFVARWRESPNPSVSGQKAELQNMYEMIKPSKGQNEMGLSWLHVDELRSVSWAFLIWAFHTPLLKSVRPVLEPLCL